MAGFIKRPELIEERHKTDDLLDFSAEVGRLEGVLAHIPSSALIGYIGRFGSGKSTAIYQIAKKYVEDADTRWFEFDAWKYPERKDLWEGFVLDVADQLGSRKDVMKKVDGTGGTAKTVGAVARIANAIGVLPGVSSFVETFSKLFEQQPIERVFEIQEVLASMLSALRQKSIFIVVEDIDRSGDAGRYFLETLRQFIKNNLQEKRIIVLVPIGSEVFDRDENLRDSYYKVLDYIEYFRPALVGYEKFIEAMFDASSFPQSMPVAHLNGSTQPVPWRENLQDWFGLAGHTLTIREIKGVIRRANATFQLLQGYGFTPDPRIVLAMTLLDYIKTDRGRRWSEALSTDQTLQNNHPLSSYFQAMARNEPISSFTGKWKTYPIEWVDDSTRPIPTFVPDRFDDSKCVYVLSQFYLIPFGKVAPPERHGH